MKILHYSLGFPPYSRGGLTKYAIDLIETQIKQGHCVSMLWPGSIDGKAPKIVRRKSVNNVGSFELKNPEFLPQIYGIKDIDEFQKDVNGDSYRRFLKEYNPEVIHIHTLMGMHLKFLEVARELGIKTVYTSHDFFGICPKSTLFFNGSSCEYNDKCIGCSKCCENALSVKKMRILQSSLYRNLKETAVMKKIRSSQKSKVFALDDAYKTLPEKDYKENNTYMKLREGYLKYFSLITTIHFNSSYMKKVFSHYMNVDNGIVCNITHCDIKNNFDKYSRKLKDNHLEITYMGPIAEYKGYFMLKKALDKLYKKGKRNFTLTIYHQIENPEKYMKIKPPYKYETLNEVMNDADLVAALNDVSYGFTVLEALSYGVPVFVTEEVGAKDLVNDKKTGIVCDYNVESICEGIEKLLDNPRLIEDMKKNIKAGFKVKEMSEHSKEIVEKIYKE